MNAPLLVLALVLGQAAPAPAAPPQGGPPAAPAADAKAPPPTLARPPEEARPPAASVTAWATEIAAMLQAGNVDGVSARFDPRLASLLSPEAFRDGWKGIEAKNGKLQSIGAPVLKNAGKVDLAVMPARFEKVEWTLAVAFDGEGRLTSLRFTPMSLDAAANAPPPVEYRAPKYANPKKFKELEVRIGADPWVLPGTISMPVGKGPFPGVVLVHGSGPRDQDETVGGMKTFRDLAWGLASQGIAVLRYAKRTQVHGDKMGSAPVTVKEEVVDDAVAALKALRETPGVDPRRVVVLGHSLGGYLAPRIAMADGRLAGEIALAGSFRPIHELLLDQTDYLVENGAATEADVAPLRKDAEAIRAIEPTRTPPPGRIMGAPAAYWLDLYGYNPGATARRAGIPILVLMGGRDYQVTEKDLAGWKKELAETKLATFKVIPKANHFFVLGEGKSLPADVATPGNVAPEVVNAIARWVKALPPRK